MPSRPPRKQEEDETVSIPIRKVKTFKKRLKERETDAHKIKQREKQISFGKNTIGYHNYIKQVPKNQRSREHPRTPDAYSKQSKRAWDGVVRKWRKQLHVWDNTEQKENTENSQDAIYKEQEDLDRIESELAELEELEELS